MALYGNWVEKEVLFAAVKKKPVQIHKIDENTDYRRLMSGLKPIEAMG